MFKKIKVITGCQDPFVTFDKEGEPEFHYTSKEIWVFESDYLQDKWNKLKQKLNTFRSYLAND